MQDLVHVLASRGIHGDYVVEKTIPLGYGNIKSPNVFSVDSSTSRQPAKL